MTARVMYAYGSSDSATPALMHWRCTCGGRGTDLPGTQCPCPSCGETIRIPDQPMGWEASQPELTAGVEPPQTVVAASLDPRFDLRELAYRVLTNPDLSLFGHKSGGVGLYCRACTSTTIAFLGAKEDERMPLEITYATTVSGMWAQAAIHLAIHHSQATDD